MAYDEGLAERIRELFDRRKNVGEKKMFGGLCFMLSDHMCCGIVTDMLMARVGPDNYINSLKRKNVREMDFTGRPMKGMVYVEPKGIEKDKDLEYWVELCAKFVDSLPAKRKK